MATATGATLGAVTVTAIPADKDAYDALTFAEIGEIATIAALGDNIERITFAPLKTGRVVSVPGTKDAGDLAVACVTEVSSDAGQTLMRSANGTSNLVAFKLTDPDTSFRYFVGRVANYMESERSPSINQGSTFTIWRITDISGPHTS